MVEITRENLTQFNNEGFFVARGLLDPEIDLDPIKAEYKEVLDNAVSDLQARGIIKNNYMLVSCQDSGSSIAYIIFYIRDNEGNWKKLKNVKIRKRTENIGFLAITTIKEQIKANTEKK